MKVSAKYRSGKVVDSTVYSRADKHPLSPIQEGPVASPHISQPFRKLKQAFRGGEGTAVNETSIQRKKRQPLGRPYFPPPWP